MLYKAGRIHKVATVIISIKLLVLCIYLAFFCSKLSSSMTLMNSLTFQEVHTYTVLIIYIAHFINPQALFLVKFLLLRKEKNKVIEKIKHHSTYGCFILMNGKKEEEKKTCFLKSYMLF